MNVYAVIALAPSPGLDRAISENYANNSLQISPTSWLVAGSGTAQDISNTLGVTAGGVGSTVVFSTAGYFGRAPTNIWEWIKAKLEAPANA